MTAADRLHLVTVQLNRPSERFAHWDYESETRELIHRREGYRIALEAVLSGSDEMLRRIFQVHDKPWGDANVLDELVELLGTYFKGERLLLSDTRS
jgi:hypothetical protein